MHDTIGVDVWPGGAEAGPAIFLDKDGTLINDVPFNVDPDLIHFAPGAESGLRHIAAYDVPLIVVSNQSGVAMGNFPEEALRAVHCRLSEMFADVGARLAAFYACPHHPAGIVAAYTKACSCRKPAPGMLLRASRELDIDLGASWMIGDILDDVEAGQRAGSRTILIDNGNETVWRPGPYRTPTLRCADIGSALRHVASLLNEGGAAAPEERTDG